MLFWHDSIFKKPLKLLCLVLVFKLQDYCRQSVNVSKYVSYDKNIYCLHHLWWHDWLYIIFMRDRETQRLLFIKAWCPFPQSPFRNISEVILRHLNRKVELTAETCRELLEWHPLRFGLGLMLALQHQLGKLTEPNNHKANMRRLWFVHLSKKSIKLQFADV